MMIDPEDFEFELPDFDLKFNFPRDTSASVMVRTGATRTQWWRMARAGLLARQGRHDEAEQEREAAGYGGLRQIEVPEQRHLLDN